MSSFATFLLLMLGLVFYLLPSVISATRNTQHSGAIFAVNLLFGWTTLGWIAALIWAIVEQPARARVYEKPWTESIEPSDVVHQPERAKPTEQLWRLPPS